MDDLERLRNEYSDRKRRLAASDIYSPFNRAHLFLLQQRQRNVLDLLRQQGFSGIRGFRILELGCGGGNVLLEYLGYGTPSFRLHGTDLLLDRVREARGKLPNLPLTCADGQNLPYQDQSFDLVLQYMVHSSILDDDVKRDISREMLRVLRPGGLILWYDFWLNPTNPQTRGIRPAEIRSLFPGCRFEFQRITLAPPIARRFVPVSWLGCSLLENLKVFNTHYLAAIRPEHAAGG